MFTYNGLTMSEMTHIHAYYEAACTAEYVMENYDFESEDEALKIGYEVRRLMYKYNYTEEEAVAICISRR